MKIPAFLLGVFVERDAARESLREFKDETIAAAEMLARRHQFFVRMLQLKFAQNIPGDKIVALLVERLESHMKPKVTSLSCQDFAISCE